MAKKKRELLPEDLSGMSIYHDDKRTVYSPFFLNKAYVLTKENCRRYYDYIKGYLMSLLIFGLAYIITKNILISLLLGLAFMAGTIYVFYAKFIKKAAVIPDYRKPAKDSFFIRQAKNLDLPRIWTIIICCFLLSIVIIFNGYLNGFTGAYRILNLILAIVPIVYAIMHIWILIYKKRNNL